MTTNLTASRRARARAESALLVLFSVGAMAPGFGAAPSATPAPTASVAAGASGAPVRLVEVRGARRFVDPGVQPVRVEVRMPARSAGVGCGGGGCTQGVDVRALAGALPAVSYSFYFPDEVRRSHSSGCPATRDFSTYFSAPRVAEIAPTVGPDERTPDCGLVSYDTATRAAHHWVFLRVQP